MNEKEYINKFCLYFYSVAGDLISESVKEENLLRFDNFDRNALNVGSDQKKLNLVLRKLSIPNVDLSSRELQTAMLYIRGRSWDQIASTLNIQSETARAYLKEAKYKLGTKTKSSFFDKAYDIGLHTLPVDYILGLNNNKKIIERV